MNSEIEQATRVIWDYHRLGHVLEPADLIFVLCSHDLRVAGHAADLYHRGVAPRVAISGGFGVRQTTTWTKPEAQMFAEVMRNNGVPEEALLLEARSSNTGENVAFTREMLRARGINVRSVVAVQKPYMERRTFATICRQWPEVELQVSSPPCDFAEYCAGTIPQREVIEFMVGDLQRIMEYPARGFMISQVVPPEVLAAYETLVDAGFTGHLIGQGARTHGASG